MRGFLMLAGLALSSAALAQAPAPSPANPPEKPLYRFPGLPELPAAGPERRAVGPRGQLFVSPAGEPFRSEPGTPYPSATWFAQADSDHDGKIDRTEFAADFDRFFAILDVNHDNIVDPSEVGRYERDILPEVTTGDSGFGLGFPGGGRGRGRRPGGGRQNIAGNGGAAGQETGSNIEAPAPRARDDVPIIGAGRYGMINIPEPVTSMDINLDGTITPYELRQAATRRFTLLDPDNHGALRLADLPHPEAQRTGEGNRRRRDDR